MMGLRHVALRVGDIKRVAAFYQKYFLMQVDWEPDENNVYLSSGGKDNLALHQEDGIDPRQKSQGLDHIGFFLNSESDVDALYQQVTGDGVEIVAPPKRHRDNSYSFYMRDPEGFVVQALFFPPSLGA